MTGTLAQVDYDRCKQIAEVLKDAAMPSPKEDTELPASLSKTQAGNLLLLQVAICHQTQTLSGTVDGRNCRGWDYLTRSSAKATGANPSLVDPQAWAIFTQEHLSQLLGSAGISQPLERIELVKNLGEVMISNGWRWADEIHRASMELLQGLDQPGVLSRLRSFKAYADPIGKKSHFFLGLMKAAGLWSYGDEEHLLPPVDYHEIRGHLRLGTVLLEPALREAIERREQVSPESDIAIRQAVLNAIVEISLFDGVASPMTLHYFFWNIFRTICTREKPQCTNAQRDLLPERYRFFIQSDDNSCGFKNVCASANKSNPISEHVFLGHWY